MEGWGELAGVWIDWARRIQALAEIPHPVFRMFFGGMDSLPAFLLR